MTKSPAEMALGPMFIGTALNITLYGIMIAQVYLYFYSGKRDRTWLKCVVLFLFLADTLNAIFGLVYIYDALIINFDNAEYLATANWICATIPAMTGIIASCVQLCFAWRVKIITNNIWVVILIVSCAIVSMLASIGTSIAVEIVLFYTEFDRFKIVVIVWLVAAAIADGCIAVSLTSHLHKNKTGFGAMDDVLDRIIRLTIQTGAMTTIWASVHLTVYLADNTGTHLVFGVPLSKLYSNSLMSSLNARGVWKISQRSGESHIFKGDAAPAKSPGDILLITARTNPDHFVHVKSDETADVECGRTFNHLVQDP